MAIRRTEHANFTREQIAEHVMHALEIAATAELTGDDRAALLPQIFDKLASKQVVLEEYRLGTGLDLPNGLPR